MKKIIYFLCLPLLFFFTSSHACGQSYLDRADSLYTENRWSMAKENYLVYLGDTSKNAIAWNHLAVCNFNLKLYNQAIANFKRALSCNPPGNAKYIIEARLAKSYAANNQLDEALSWLSRAVASGFVNLNELDTASEYITIRANTKFKEIRQLVYAKAFPCAAEPKSHDFDFWLGEWNVYITNTHSLAGHSLVESIAGGCAILENWTAIGNHSGKSINYFDTKKGKWEQDWVGSSGDIQHYINGNYENGMMRFTYTKTNNESINGSFIFYNISKDTVRQYQDTIDKDGKINVVYDFTYIRKK